MKNHMYRITILLAAGLASSCTCIMAATRPVPTVASDVTMTAYGDPTKIFAKLDAGKKQISIHTATWKNAAGQGTANKQTPTQQLTKDELLVLWYNATIRNDVKRLTTILSSYTFLVDTIFSYALAGRHAGISALHWAARCNDRSMIELLLKHGANPNIPDERYHAAPLHHLLKAHANTSTPTMVAQNIALLLKANTKLKRESDELDKFMPDISMLEGFLDAYHGENNEAVTIVLEALKAMHYTVHEADGCYNILNVSSLSQQIAALNLND